jgi:hypothetical protein
MNTQPMLLMLLENTFQAQFTTTQCTVTIFSQNRKKMFGGIMLPLFAVCIFTLHNLPAGNMVTTLQYSNFYVCMLCNSVQVGTEQLQGCG